KRAGTECVEVLALAVGAVAINVGAAAKHNGEPNADLADPCQRLAGGEAVHLSEPPRALDVGGVELRHDLVAPRLDNRGTRITHLSTFSHAAAGFLAHQWLVI